MSPRFITRSGKHLKKGDFGWDGKIPCIRITTRWADNHKRVKVWIFVPKNMEGVFNARTLAQYARHYAVIKFPPSWHKKTVRTGQRTSKVIDSFSWDDYRSGMVYGYVFEQVYVETL